MRHRANKKSFALIYERNGKLCVNLKCDPIEADLNNNFTIQPLTQTLDELIAEYRICMGYPTASK